jgi:hypothetical protein
MIGCCMINIDPAVCIFVFNCFVIYIAAGRLVSSSCTDCTDGCAVCCGCCWCCIRLASCLCWLLCCPPNTPRCTVSATTWCCRSVRVRCAMALHMCLHLQASRHAAHSTGHCCCNKAYHLGHTCILPGVWCSWPEMLLHQDDAVTSAV